MEYEDLPKSRKEALERNSKFYFTGRPCKHGHTDARYTSGSDCVVCCGEQARKQREKHSSEEWKQKRQEIYLRRKAKSAQEARRYRENNRQKLREYHREYYKGYRDRAAERIRATLGRYRSNNRGKLAAKASRRRGRRLQATPAWLTDQQWDAIFAIYDEAARVSDETGVPHHVDHIEPLQGKEVCGLHVPWNLRIIPADENIRKSNKRLPTL